MMPENYATTNPGCHGNEISDKIGNISARVTGVIEILVSNIGFSG